MHRRRRSDRSVHADSTRRSHMASDKGNASISSSSRTNRHLAIVSVHGQSSRARLSIAGERTTYVCMISFLGQTRLCFGSTSASTHRRRTRTSTARSFPAGMPPRRSRSKHSVVSPRQTSALLRRSRRSTQGGHGASRLQLHATDDVHARTRQRTGASVRSTIRSHRIDERTRVSTGVGILLAVRCEHVLHEDVLISIRSASNDSRRSLLRPRARGTLRTVAMRQLCTLLSTVQHGASPQEIRRRFQSSPCAYLRQRLSNDSQLLSRTSPHPRIVACLLVVF